MLRSMYIHAVYIYLYCTHLSKQLFGGPYVVTRDPSSHLSVVLAFDVHRECIGFGISDDISDFTY